MRGILLCLVGLLITTGTQLREGRDVKTEATLSNRFEYVLSRYRLEESLIGLADAARQPGTMLLIRICSKEPMPKALILSAASPNIVYDYMSNFYNYPRERIRILRSENCLSEKTALAATELWVVPKDGEVPSSAESININQVSGRTIQSGNKIKSSSEFNAALQRLITTLRKRPQSIGVVEGYYFNKPSSAMRRALQAAKESLGGSKLQASRYLVHLRPWSDEVPSSPSEPKYPSVYIIEVFKEDNAK